MEYVNSFSANKAGKAFVVSVDGIHPDGKTLVFHVDSGASVTFLGLDSFCSPSKKDDYKLLKDLIVAEIEDGGFEKVKKSASTATNEEVEMYPCKIDRVVISDTREITLYFYIYLGLAGMPLLGFDYIDDCSFQHRIDGDLIFVAFADNPGKRFYPEKVIDFTKIISQYNNKRNCM